MKGNLKSIISLGVSICAVVLLVLGSLSNVVGYQTVQTSQQNLIKERINQRELLFQTICDIANNKEIQGIVIKSQMSRGIFPISDIPLFTKQQLKQMYFIGLILSKIISRTRMQSMVQQNQLINPEIQKKISAVIEKDAILNGEIIQLQNSECDCENESSTVLWRFPVICTILLPIIAFTAISSFIFEWYLDFYRVAAFFWILFLITFTIALTINCYYF